MVEREVGQNKWEAVQCCLNDGWLLIYEPDASNAQAIALADIEGVTVQEPKSKRPGKPFCLRVEKRKAPCRWNSKDSQGKMSMLPSKLILAFATADQMNMWRGRLLASSQQSAAGTLSMTNQVARAPQPRMAEVSVRVPDRSDAVTLLRLSAREEHQRKIRAEQICADEEAHQDLLTAQLASVRSSLRDSGTIEI